MEENKVLKDHHHTNPYEEPQSEEMDMLRPYGWCQVVLTHDNDSEMYEITPPPPSPSPLTALSPPSLMNSSHETNSPHNHNLSTEEKEEDHHSQPKLQPKEFERESSDSAHTLGDEASDNNTRTASMFSWSRGWLKPIPIDEEPSDSPCSQDSVVRDDHGYGNSKLQFSYDHDDECSSSLKNLQLDDYCETLSTQEQHLNKCLPQQI